MKTITQDFTNSIKASTRRIKGKVELYNSSDTLLNTYQESNNLMSIEITRAGELSKFFGFGVSQKIKIKLLDTARSINITTDNYFKAYLGVVLPNSTTEYVSYPSFYVTEVNRDEKTNSLSITGYDLINKTSELLVNDIALTAPYTITEYINSVATALETTAVIPSLSVFNTSYATGANLSGTEKVRDTLNAIAEVTNTIYYLDTQNRLVFKRLDIEGNEILGIDKSVYIDLKTSPNKRLQTIASVTELGDNISSSTMLIGSTQYLRDNPFIELRTDAATLLDNAIADVGDMTIGQFNCSWRGNPALEIGDKIKLTNKDGSFTYSYLFSDVLTYDGGLTQKSEWSYEETEETESNPTSLGDALNKTYARVDKAAKQIEIAVNDVTEAKSDIASLKINQESINATVSSLSQVTQESLETINENISTLTNSVNASITAEQVQLQINETIADGVESVTTSTGFTLNDEGLTISRTGSEMTTNIDEDGMSIFRDNTEVLTADNNGVNAINLHATTYLIIGDNSRFEDYEADGEQRTGCFWIGGN